MKPKKITEESFKIIGMDCLSSKKENKDETDISELWEEFRPRINEVNNKVKPDNLLGIYIQNKIYPDRFTYVAGVEVENIKSIPRGMIPKIISSSQYAVFIHEGTRDNISQTYNHIFNTWEKNSDYEINRKAERIENIISENEIEILIPVSK